MTGKNNNILNISLSILFFILAIVIYIIRITMPASNSNQLTDTLFSGFEIIFSVGIGIFLQRYESNRQYLDNLKKYALRAYRRISDIQKSVSRMATVIEQDRPVVDKETSLKLDTLQAINEGLNDTVQSSSADWVDILYPELEKKQRLDKLEEKRNEIETLSSSDKTTDRIYEQLTEEIRTLKSELPYLLRLDTKEELPRGGRYSDIVYKHFQTTIETQNNIIIEVTPLFELNDEAIQKIANSKAFTFRESAGMSKMRLMVSNENGDLGIVNNPFDEVYSNDFTFTLNQVLVDSFVRTNTGPWPGMDNISIPGIDFAGVSSSKQIFYLRIPFNRSELQPR